MRVFAGPNGSGKSTLKGVIPPDFLGVYVNADDIQYALNRYGRLDLAEYHVNPAPGSLEEFLQSSPLLQRAGLSDFSQSGIHVRGGILTVDHQISAYLAGAIAAYIREALLRQRISFTFETVMSSPDKIEFMRRALNAGFRVYLYYIATSDPEINKSRVHNRVASGGHDVPDDKIVARYYRSLDQLYDAIRSTSRAYIFDNSTDEVDKVWVAEGTDGRAITPKVDQVPLWFARYVLDRAAARNTVLRRFRSRLLRQLKRFRGK